MTFVEHLTELRRRLIAVAAVMVAAAGAAYAFVDRIVAFLLAPASGADFVYLTPPELFLAYLRVSLVAGVVVTIPFTLTQIWVFLRPGLTSSERRATRFTFLGGSVFFALGAAFAYLVVLPTTLGFFLRFASSSIVPMFSFGSYVGFVISLLVALGLAFEMPMVLIALVRLELVGLSTLRAARPYVVLALLALSALITPPDVVSQIILAGPMVALYELSLICAWAIRRREAVDETEEHAVR